MIASSTLLRWAGRSQLYRSSRRFSDAASPPVRRSVSMEERAAHRAARKERSQKLLAQARGAPAEGEAATSTGASLPGASILSTRWVWYLGVAVPVGVLVWGYNDQKSPPAKFSRAIGLTDLLSSWTEDFAKPAHDKLLPDWDQVRYGLYISFYRVRSSRVKFSFSNTRRCLFLRLTDAERAS
jgi:hypothetical protein